MHAPRFTDEDVATEPKFAGLWQGNETSAKSSFT